MDQKSLKEYTVREIVDKFAYAYLAELTEFQLYITENPTHDDTRLELPIGIQEFNYHYGSAYSNKRGHKKSDTPLGTTGYNLTNLATIRLNNLFPDYKILSDRTQDYLYERALDRLAIAEPDWFTLDLATHLTTKRLDQIIKWLVYTHPHVEDFMRPIADQYEVFAQGKIDRINNIPGPAQKSPEWFAARQNTISASVCGYADSKACRLSIGEEAKQVREKAEIGPKQQFNSASHPLKHGCNYEGLTENYYSTTRGYTVGEYGLIIEPTATHIGASPDGIVLNTHSKSYLHRKRHARMLEIKNPTSRAIDKTIPSYYYWQMLQQMYVCQIPFCDFLQTRFQYPNLCDWELFQSDTLDFQTVIASCSEWSQLYNHLASYIMDTACDYHRLREVYENDHGEGSILDLSVTDLGTEMVTYFLDSENFEYITNMPPCNLNRRGQIKGILRAYMKGNYDEIASKYFTFGIPMNDRAAVDAQFQKWDSEMAVLGFVPEKVDYWALETYLLSEVEYNAALYDNGTDDSVFMRLTRLWDFIMELRAIPEQDTRMARYLTRYPESEHMAKKRAAAATAKPTETSKVTYDLDSFGMSV